MYIILTVIYQLNRVVIITSRRAARSSIARFKTRKTRTAKRILSLILGRIFSLALCR